MIKKTFHCILYYFLMQDLSDEIAGKCISHLGFEKLGDPEFELHLWYT